MQLMHSEQNRPAARKSVPAPAAAGFHQGAPGMYASVPFPVVPAPYGGGGAPAGLVPGGVWPAASYGYLPQWAPATSMALFVPAYLPMQYAGQQLPDTAGGQGSQARLQPGPAPSSGQLRFFPCS